MSELKITIDEIKELMDKMAKTGLGKLAIEENDFKMTLCAKKEAVRYTEDATERLSSRIIGGADGSTVIYTADTELVDGNIVAAPIVGTYYNAPSPDKEPFVKVGQAVKKGDVLFIIESMKLMNEVQSEWDGEVTEMFVKTGSPVEYGQNILVIR